jgi:lipopolysaccharide export system permease protein
MDSFYCVPCLTMRLLDRYLLRELLIPLGYCLGGFLLFWIAFDLFAELGEFQRKGLHAREIVEYYLLTTPEFLVMILPITLLLGLLYTLSHLARYHEITAMRAAGLSLWRLSLPYFAVGLFLSLVTFAINEYWAPDSSDAAEAIMNRYVVAKSRGLGRNKVRDLGFTNSKDARIWQITIYNSETGEMTAPQALWSLSDGSRLWLKAERGTFTNNVWTFFNAALFRIGAETNSAPMPMLQTNILAMPEFSESPELIRSEIRISNQLLIGRAKKADIPIVEIFNYLRLHPNPSRSERNWLQTKFHGRLAAPWTCVVVVLIALPFGSASGRRNVFVGVASSILICFAYFVLQQVGLALGTGGYVVPWLAAWIPNLCFGLAGLWMTARVR